MPTINESIVATGDDAYSTPSYLSVNAARNPVGAVVGVAAYGGARFQTLAIPQGSTIDSATLTTFKDSTGASSVTVRIYGADVDDAGAWSASNRMRLITKTAAYHEFATTSGADANPQNRDVTAIVQEIVNRAGWASGNDMGFACFPQTATGTRTWNFADYNHATLDAAALEVTFTSPISDVRRSGVSISRGVAAGEGVANFWPGVGSEGVVGENEDQEQ